MVIRRGLEPDFESIAGERRYEELHRAEQPVAGMLSDACKVVSTLATDMNTVTEIIGSLPTAISALSLARWLASTLPLPRG